MQGAGRVESLPVLGRKGVPCDSGRWPTQVSMGRPLAGVVLMAID